ncbi:efflux RND transporter periplasmic adaptor subunit [Humisphaera borealis]|uniref:Efflux RND transporter periplasmic adaptor subunit n=1 Tax=Humisphaera borealis TaxID=2807512 RepID=A0A7M2WR41_9BACT|nr:efflux RND transporter periplasmic adaptor subunit [Humisphaera borealis]QOV87903.1 efflux RND transporter periplasmic adaptor subunit [Humisphaera borealis]
MPHPKVTVLRNPRRLLLATATAVSLVLGAAVASSVVGCGEKGGGGAGPAKPAAAVPITTGQARLGQVQRTVQVVGDLHGEEDATISNKVPGRLIAIYKDVGDRVEPGEPLAQLLRNDYLLSVQQKRSALLESLAKLGVNDVPGDGFDVGGLPAVRRAKLQSENAEAKFNRGKQLFDQKPPLISQQDYEDLKTGYDVAKSNLEVETATAQGLIGEARTRLADLRVAEQALSDSTIKAPSDTYASPNTDPTTRPGPAVAALTEVATEPASRPAATPGKTGRYFVARRFASLGELASAITPMFRLVDDDPLKLKAAVPERYYRELAIGQPVKVRIDAYPDAFSGQVTRISPQVDEANRTFPIEVQIPNTDRKLPPGAFARATIDTRMEENVVLIPAAAVVSFAGVDKVFVVNEGKVKEVQVKLGDRIGSEYEIRQGLKGKEVLATSGTSRLATGVAVQVKPATQPATQPQLKDQ